MTQKDPPFGAGSLQAAARLGLEELRQAFAMGVRTEPGMYGTALAQDIAAERSSEATPSAESTPPRPTASIFDRFESADRQAQPVREPEPEHEPDR